MGALSQDFFGVLHCFLVEIFLNVTVIVEFLLRAAYFTSYYII